jgi:mono/diheme cytochrome c family protein
MKARSFALLLVFVPCTLLLAQTPAAPTAKPQAAGNADAGKRLYADMTCFFCHGTAGQGGSAGARIALVQRSAEAFIRYVRRPSGAMPAFGERILTDQQLTDIYAFLRAQTVPKAAKDIPLLSQIKSQ